MSLKTHMNDSYEVGLDEAGRGPCFGRLYVAGVVWPKDNTNPPSFITDSKALSSSKLEQAYRYIIDKVPMCDRWISYSEVEEVNQLGPLKADMKALHRCLDLFPQCPDHILMDGNYFKPSYSRNNQIVPHTTVVKGDSKYYSIAAASILAKYCRDQYIRELCHQYPLLTHRYGILTNKGYLTSEHQKGIDNYGISEYHRHNYKCCRNKNQLSVKSKIKPVIRLKQNNVKE